MEDAQCFAATTVQSKLKLVAVGELRRSYLRAPVEGLGDHVVLLGVPEGAAVHAIVGVDTHGAVITPAVRRIRLRARTGDDWNFCFQHT